jgi:juvenile hormone diol kinase
MIPPHPAIGWSARIDHEGKGNAFMVSALRKRKLARLFRLYDVDRNGLVEQTDFALIAHKTALAMNHQPGSPAYNTLHNQYMTGWARLAQLGDANDDQRLTLEEYCAAYDKMLAQPAQFTAMMMGIVSTIIMLLDTDKDGKVSVPEYTAIINSRFRKGEEVQGQVGYT